jgi:mannosyltransferase
VGGRLFDRPVLTALVLALPLAALNVLWGLGSSSLFVDEAFSWSLSLVPAGDLYDAVSRSEVAAPTFYAVLHVWRAVFGDSEVALRVMSVCAVVPLVGLTVWLSAMLGRNRLAGVFGGLLAAASPLVLEYGTQVRAYIFCMLAVTLAVAGAVRYVRGPTRERKWLVLSGAGAVGALWLHYTAIPIVAALALWLLLDRRVPRRLSVGYALALSVAQGAVTPLMLAQRQNAGAKAYSTLTFDNVVRTFGAPLDGRYPVSVLLPLASLIAFVIAAVWAVRRSSLQHAAVAAIAIASPVALLVLTLFSDDALLSRYSAVAAPLMIAVIAASAAQDRWLWPAAGIVLCLALGGSVASHTANGQYPDLGGAYDVIAHSQASTAPIVIAPTTLGELASQPLVNYYRRELPGTPTLTYPQPKATRVLTNAPRAWIIRDQPLAAKDARIQLNQAFKATLVRSETLPGRSPIQVLLVKRR